MRKQALVRVILMAVLLLLTLFTIAEAEGFSGTCGSTMNWSAVKDDEGHYHLNITGSGEMTSAPWESEFDLRQGTVEVIISEGVQTIADNAFHAFFVLSDVTLPSSLTRIGYGAFGYCYNLGEIQIPKGVTEIGKNAFESCRALETANLPVGLVEIPDSIFSGCEKLSGIIIPEGVTVIGDRAFSGCYSIKAINIPAKVWNIGMYAFATAGLNEVTIPGSVTEMGPDAFVASSLKKVTVLDGATKIGEYAFKSCAELQEVLLPDSLLYIGNHAFDSCSSLKSISIPSNIGIIQYGTFYGCESLQNVIIPEGIREIHQGAFNFCQTLGNISLPESLMRIESGAFHNCNLKEVTLSGAIELLDKLAFDLTVLIRAPEGSYAAQWAAKNNYRFEAISLPLTFAELRYSFSNDSGADIPLERFQRFFPQPQAKILYWMKHETNGLCFGFASTSILFNRKNSGLALSSFGVDRVSSLQRSSPGVEELLQTAHVMRFTLAYMFLKTKNDLNSLVKAVEKGIQERAVPVIGISRSDKGHALVGYKLEKINDTTVLLYVYDCNYPSIGVGSKRAIVLTTDDKGNYTKWYYKINDSTDVGSDYAGSSIDYMTNYQIADIWSSHLKAKSSGNITEKWLSTIQGDDWKIVSSSGSTIADMKNGSFKSYDSSVLRYDGGTIAHGTSLIYSDNADFSVTNTSSDRKLEVNTAGQRQGALVAATANSVQFMINDDKSTNEVVLDTQKDDTFDVTLLSELPEAASKKEMKISGKSEGAQVVIGMSGSDVVINNCTDVSISINDQPVQNLEEISKNINFYDVSLEYTEAAYSGKAIKPGIIVKGKDLKEGTDYKITYENNIGSPSETTTAAAIIQGLGEYTGTKTLLFTILPEGKALKNSKISAIKDQVYTGKAITPKFTVTYKGTKLVKDTDYTITWKDNKKIGTATLTVSGKGMYTGEKKVTFKIIPKAVKLSSLKAGTKQLTVKWKKGSGIDGYEIEYSLKKNFKGAKTVTISKAKTTSTEIKKLKAKKTYYVRIRTFKKVKGKKYYSEWSKVLKKKIK